VLDPNTKRFLQSQMIWIAISLGISLALSFLLPFPINLIAMIAVFIGMNYFIRQRQMRKMGMRGGSLFGAGAMFGQRTIEYYCISCGTKHNERACPNCGSNMKRVGS
jgi:hypothetical protein